MALKNRITIVAPSGETYIVIKASPVQMGAAGLSAMIRVKAAQANGTNAETNPELAESAFALMRKTLGRFLVTPRFFDGHPTECPEGWTTFEDLGDDATFLYREITSSEEGEAAAESVATFPIDSGGVSVP